jgi:uncharacterized protein (DUF486 family)
MNTVLLLIVSNIFMTIAWYGHLRFGAGKPMIAVILASWGIAFFEYCAQVPANRMGYGQFTAFQLKIIQEVITIVVFVIFAWIALGERVRWNHLLSFLFILLAVVAAFYDGGAKAAVAPASVLNPEPVPAVVRVTSDE